MIVNQYGFRCGKLDSLIRIHLDDGMDSKTLIGLHPCTLHPEPCTLNPEPYTLNPEPCSLLPEPYTLNPEP